MSPEQLLLLAIGALVAAGAAGLLPLPGDLAQRAGAGLFTLGSALGLGSAAIALGGTPGAAMRLPWALPGAELVLRVDALSAWFLVPVFVIPCLGTWYGLEYWRQTEHPESSRRVQFFYPVTTAAMAMVVASKNGVLFLAAWEVMAVSAFFLVAAEDRVAEVREAGWLYWVAAHVCLLALLALFAVYGSATGSLQLERTVAGSSAASAANEIFLLAVAGFGIKAGMIPLHVWLPSAHANAPSHVSALMSGVLIKMGVYGMMRVTWMFGTPPLWWGTLLIGAGVISAVLGVAFALGQHDLKRLLAYHSIENIGIILIGLGVAVTGRATGQPVLVALGLAGALLHTWNHGLFKALLFLGAGAVLHRSHTRQIDRLGGLAKVMPWTSSLFLLGAVAICGLPPLNGFVSELLVYLGLFNGMQATDPLQWLPAAIAIPGLGLVGALALACFVKVQGAVFLGEPRSDHARDARECGRAMLLPMGLMGAACAAIGLLPALLAPPLERATAAWSSAGTSVSLQGLAPLSALTPLGAAMLLAMAMAALALRPRRPVTAVGTWDCGFAMPTPRMQYTSSSFAQILVGLWAWALIPVRSGRVSVRVFARGDTFASHVPDTVLDRALLPALRAAAWALGWLRPLQRGNVNAYLFYVVLALFVLLVLR